MKQFLLLANLIFFNGFAFADEPKPAKVDAPLPEGWPEPTQPGVIEIKDVPAYRSAMVQTDGDADQADNKLFWQLFTHIKLKQILFY